ncbi:MAG: hypothetical protein ACR2M7_03600 [Bdellovibrionales bacterium]
MFLFRLISFGLKLISTFLVVFILQIKFDGKTLEDYLVHAGKDYLGTKLLHQVSADSVKIIRNRKNFPSQKKAIHRDVSSAILPRVEDFKKRLELFPKEKKKELKKNQIKNKSS